MFDDDDDVIDIEDPIFDEDEDDNEDEEDDEDSDDEGECPTCLDTEYICEECSEADGDCTCEDGPTLVPCPDCGVGRDQPMDQQTARLRADASRLPAPVPLVRAIRML